MCGEAIIDWIFGWIESAFEPKRGNGNYCEKCANQNGETHKKKERDHWTIKPKESTKLKHSVSVRRNPLQEDPVQEIN